MPDLPTYMTRGDIADLFRTSTTTVRRWVDEGVLPPPQKIGRAPTLERWLQDDVMAALRNAVDGRRDRNAGSADPDQIAERYARDRRQEARRSA
jgi:predicted DNA-binding transcriptional regulator AlpA